MEVIATSERMCRLRLKGRFRNLIIQSIYEPTKEKDDSEKEDVYNKLD